MILSLERHVPCDIQDGDLADGRFEPSSGALRLGGSPGAIRVESHGSVLEVRSRVFAWDQHFVGPILPVIPVLMGAGTYTWQLGLELRAASDSQPVTLALEDVLVTTAGTGASQRPTSWSPGEHDDMATPTLPLPVGAPVTLAPGTWAWVNYDIDNYSTPSFELTFLLNGERIRVQFEQQSTPFVGTVLPTWMSNRDTRDR